jgi:hypothetical protein
MRELSKWLSEGRIVRKFHIIRGLENAPQALPLFFTGANTGKLSVPTSSQHRFPVLTHWNLPLPELFRCPELKRISEE